MDEYDESKAIIAAFETANSRDSIHLVSHAAHHVQLRPGQPCPTCGRKVPMTGAERQRRWRARRLKMRKDFYAKTTQAGMKAAGLS